jgi:hypothetical protein
LHDLPFDEAIYSANHLLRAPGACKAAQGVGELAPVLGETPRMLVEERGFDQIFPPHHGDANLPLGHSLVFPRRILRLLVGTTICQMA